MTSDSRGSHFPNDASSAGEARRFVTSTLEGWGLGELAEVASLLVSELVSNALLHAGTELDVNLRRSDGRVRVEVHDRSPRLPERKYYSTTSVTGRGLVFVSELSQAWGFEPTDTGKSVWFELDEAAAPAIPAMAMDTDLLLESWDDWDGLEPGEPPDRPEQASKAATGGQGGSRSAGAWLVGVP